MRFRLIIFATEESFQSRLHRGSLAIGRCDLQREKSLSLSSRDNNKYEGHARHIKVAYEIFTSWLHFHSTFL